jgi:uncharacterized membrane protein
MTASIPGGLSEAATGAEQTPASSPEPGAAGLERTIARLLTIGTSIAIVLLVGGLALMLAGGVAPLSGGPAFDPASLVGDVLALRASGFIWLGLIVVVATPSARVLASLVGYARADDRTMAVVAGLILIVIAVSVALAKGLEG